MKSVPAKHAMDMNTLHREATVLLVDDDARVSMLTGDWLERKGYVVDYASCGSDALTLAAEQHFDAIILDVDMPGMNGLAVCRKLRDTTNPKTPIIMLTARASLESKIEGLEVGADDYMAKPFAPDELAARLSAHIRRDRDEVAPEFLQLEGLSVDPMNCIVIRDERPLYVLPTGVAILAALMRAHPRVLTRSELQSKIWGASAPESDSLRSHIYQLRRALNAGFDEQLVETIPGVGFRFRAPRYGEILADEPTSTAKRAIRDEESGVATAS